MKFVLITFCFLYMSVVVASECVESKEFIAYPENVKTIGMYQRIHPEGKYVLHSSMGYGGGYNNQQPLTRVTIFDISKKDENGKSVAEPIMTPMNDEVYPVMTDWSLFASPNHQDGMRYYSLSNVLESKQNAAATFSDRNHNEYYQSVGELNDSTPETKKIRVTLYSGRRTRDYNIDMKDGKPESMNSVKEGNICENIVNPEVKSKADEAVKAREKYNIISAKQRELSDKYPRASAKEKVQIEAEYNENQLEMNRLLRIFGGNNYRFSFSSPVLSHTGDEVAAQSDAPIEGSERRTYTQKIYKIKKDYSCELVEDLGFQTQKVQFSPPVKGKKGKVIFVGGFNMNGKGYTNGVYIYDRDEKKMSKLTMPGEFSQLGYPGLTKDGRAIFPACKRTDGGAKTVCGSVVVDPLQIDSETGEVKKDSENCTQKNGKTKQAVSSKSTQDEATETDSQK